LPILKDYGIDKIIESSSYPGTKAVPTLQSILACAAPRKTEQFLG